MAKPSYPATLNTSDALAPGLLGFWLLNEGGTGTAAHDSTATANTGTIASDVVWTTGDGSDPVLSFPATIGATKNYVDLGNSVIYRPSRFTIAMRFRADSSLGGNWQILMGRGSPFVGFDYLLNYNGSMLELRFSGGNVASITTSKNVWHTVIATYAGSVASGDDYNRIYVDNVEGTPDPYGVIGSGSYRLAIGCGSGSGSGGFGQGDSFGGLISYMGIWNRVFSTSDRADFLANPFRMFGGGGGGPTAVTNFAGGPGVPGQVPVNYAA
jgi:hypothetical protein